MMSARMVAHGTDAPPRWQAAATLTQNGPVRLVLTLAALLLAAPTPAAAEGFGQLPWGTKVTVAKKKIAGLRPTDDADTVRFERDALEAIVDEARAVARKAGKKAYRAWRKRKQPKPRLAAWRYWVKLAELPARVELHFVDGELYGATVGVLYRPDQKPQAAALLDLLVAKYGAPEPPAVGEAPMGERATLEWATGDGTLVLRKRVATAKERGLLHLTYRAQLLGPGVDRYLETLKDKLVEVERARAERAKAKADEETAADRERAFRHL